MKIVPLPIGFKSKPRFSRPANIKADTHYLFTTEKYAVELVYHSSMFYAPDFYGVTVKDKIGRQIWSGGDSMFLDSLFRTDFISDTYDRMVLTRVNSTESAEHMQVILIDLKTGNETVLTEEGHYYIAGHFMSFDAIFYAFKNDIMCWDIKNDKRWLLFETLHSFYPKVISWSPCPVENCVLVITEQTSNNISLFNLFLNKVQSQSTILFKEADMLSITPQLVMSTSSVTLAVSYSKKELSGSFKYVETDFFEVTF
jgi:hypothetical protein